MELQKITCNKCKELKDSTEFIKRSNIKRGFEYSCKKCFNESRSIPTSCECGKTINWIKNLNRHKTTKYHQNRVKK